MSFNLIVHIIITIVFNLQDRSVFDMAPSSPKMVKDSNMVWVDCEMTGLDTNKDHLLEIAVIVTDKDLNILAEGPDLVIHQSEEILNSMNDWCVNQFSGESGLTAKVRKSTTT